MNDGTIDPAGAGVVKIPTVTFGAAVRPATGIELSPAAQASIESALAGVPEGHGTAILEAGLRGIQAIVAIKRRLGDGGVTWTVGAYVGKPWDGNLEMGVRLAFSF